MLYTVIKQCGYEIEPIKGLFKDKANAEKYANDLNEKANEMAKETTKRLGFNHLFGINEVYSPYIIKEIESDIL